jgi:glycolate oxidase iron-sulfur subunit
MTALVAAGLEPCVHCGFCLQSCPTYLVAGDEADSPRGRIVLIRGLATGRLDPGERGVTTHLDRCLGCRACEPVCPSGVSYAPALERARSLLNSKRPVPLMVRLVHAVMAERRLGRLLFPLARALRWAAHRLAGDSWLGFALGMLASSRPARVNGTPVEGRMAPADDAATRRVAGRVALFRGCIMDGLFGHVHAAAERVLKTNGFTLVDANDQGCCGALHAHAGQHEEAVALARHNVAELGSLAPDTVIAVDAAGCGAMLKEYGRLLAGDSLEAPARALAERVRDVTELLAEGPLRAGAPLGLRVAYDPPCHLLHAQGVDAEPELMLEAVTGIAPLRHAEAEVCCGSAGSYSLAQPGLSRTVLARKVEAIMAARPDVVSSGNPGCAMQIGAGLLAAGAAIPVVHPVEILDWSYQHAGCYAG